MQVSEDGYSIDKFQQDSQLAKKFLEEVEENSWRWLDPEWRNATEDEIIDRACFTFNVLSNEMDWADKLKMEGRLH